MGAWICWRLPLGPHVAVSIGCWASIVAGGGLGVGVLVGGRMVCSATAEVRR